MTTTTPDPIPRVDIATHPRLGQRVSALSYARRALLNEDSGGLFGPSQRGVTAPIKQLLEAGDWLLDDTHPEPLDDEAGQGPSTYLAIKRPYTWGFAVDETVMNQAMTELIELTPGMATPVRQLLIELCVQTAGALREERWGPARGAPLDDSEADDPDSDEVTVDG